jgi:predicted membrane protein
MSSRAVVGLVLIVLGAGYLAQVLVPGFVFASYLRTWWPALLILIGLNGLVRHPRRPWWSLLLIAVGVLLILSAVLPTFSRYFWPIAGAVALLVIGLRMLLPSSREHAWVHTSHHHGTVEPQKLDSSDDVVDVQVSFGAGEMRNTSAAFRGGVVNVSFGSVLLDLRGAQLAPDGAVLEIKSAFAGVEVLVPTSWSLDVAGTPAFGGWENRTNNPSVGTGPTLRIRCTPTFGGVEIRN